jgi:PKD repeat protein
MSTSNTGSDLFEQRLRDSLAQYEVPYNSADWKDLERAMDSDRRGWWFGTAGLATIAGMATLVGGTIWFAATNTQLKSKATPTMVQETPEAPQEGTEGTGTRNTTSGTPQEVAPLPVNEVPLEAAVQHNAQVGSTADRHAAALRSDVTSSGTNARNASSDATKGTGSSLKTPEVPLDVTGGSPSPERAFRASVSEACSGASVEFKVEHMPENGIYLWNFGDGSFSNKANPEHTFSKPGRYQVMLSMSAAGVGSIQNKPSSDIIEIHEAPSASFNVLRQEYEGHLPSVHFENRSLGGQHYVWDFGDGETSTIAHPDHIYKSKGVYQVKLTVTNAIGCEDQIMKDVRVDKDYNLDAPSSFSPDGDGKDESFIPEALRSLGVKFNLTIYSPNGNLLYQTNDATKPWTGRPNNRGDICAPGEYVWVVDVRESLHLAETYTGKVKLER